MAVQEGRDYEQESVDTDRCLILNIIDRDQKALAALYDRYARLVYGIALRILNDTSAAEEILHDVFCQL